MAKKDRRERKRGVRREGRHEAEARQHQKGGEFVCFTLPDGVSLFKPEKDKTYHVDVLPYIAGKHNKACKPGDEFYTLTYPLYRSLGIEEKPYIAIGDLLGVKDPISEHFAKLRKAGEEWDNMKMFRSTERQLWLLFVHEQADKGVQIFDASYQTFGKLLKKEIDDSGEVDWIDNFDDIEGGATIKVRFEAKQVMSNTWITADKITFKEREDGFTADGDKKLADKILDQVEGICLDDLLKIPSYETLKAALDGEPVRGEGDDDDEDDEKPAKGRKTRSRADEPKPKAKAKAKPPVDDDDDDDDDDDADLPFDDEDDDEPPAKPAKAKARKQVTAEDLGIVKGGTVEHDEFGMCVVLRVAPDGLTVSLKDDDGDVHRDIDPSDLEPVAEKPKAKAKAKPPVDDEDDDEPPAKPAKAKAKPAPVDDDDEDDDDEPPAKPKAKAKAKPKAKPPVDDDDDEDDDEPPAKPAKAGTKKTGKDKDWDEDWEDD